MFSLTEVKNMYWHELVFYKKKLDEYEKNQYSQ